MIQICVGRPIDRARDFQISLYIGVLQKAKEEVKQDQATKLDKIKDKGHDGWTLDNFVNLEVAKKAKLGRSHVAVIRLYTGALYKPWNMALRALM